ncbi:MAG: GTP cyclohydrolase II [Candidatus Puniceispirillaceae bacterium]
MSQQTSISPSSRRLSLAFATLRRGGIVLIRTADNRAALMRAAEYSDYDDGQMNDIADSALLLCLRRQHLSALGKAPSGKRPVFTTPAQALSQDRLFAITYGHDDLSQSDIAFMGEREDSLADLATTILRQAKLLPSALIAGLISNDPQHHARLADMHALPVINAFDSAHHDSTGHWQMTSSVRAKLPLSSAPDSQIVMFRSEDGDENHFAIIVGNGDQQTAPLVRLHSQCITGDILGSLKCDCGPQLQTALSEMAKAGGGILLYLAQEGRDIGLMNKIRAYALQDGGHDTVDANHRLGFATDERIFIPAAAMLKQLGITSLQLMTNNPDKLAQLEQYGLTITNRVPLILESNPHNEAYMKTKKDKTGHLLD